MISIVLYVHDAEAHLDELLDSVFAQTFQDFELCVVDDGSTDRTGAILDAVVDPRMRVRHIPGNGRDGLHRTFNLCLAMARHDLVAVANGDDVWRPEKLERQLAEFAADQHLDVCFHDASIIDARGRVTVGGMGRRSVLHPIDDLCGRDFLTGDPVPNPTVMFRRDIVRVIGTQETGWVHDYQFWMKAALAGCRFRSLPDRLIKYRVHDGGHSTGAARRARIAAESVAMVRSVLERCTIADLFPELLVCEDGAPSIAYAHWNAARTLARCRQPELAEEHLGAARRIAPTQVGSGTTDARWFGPIPDLAAALRRDDARPPRVRLPAAGSVLALPADVDDHSIDANLRLVIDDPTVTAPLLVLTDADETTARVAGCYERLVIELAPGREPHVELLQLRPGEMASVVEGNLLDGGALLDVTGGPATSALMHTDRIGPIAFARHELLTPPR
jgi:GT2 family glycosyltransferase